MPGVGHFVQIFPAPKSRGQQVVDVMMAIVAILTVAFAVAVIVMVIVTPAKAAAADLAPADENTITIIGSPTGTPTVATTPASPAVRELFRTLDQVRRDLETSSTIVAAR